MSKVIERRNTPETLEMFARRIESRLKAGGSDTIEQLICRLLTGKDTKVAAMLLSRWTEWRFGKAKETVQITGTIEHEHHTITERLTDDELAQVENLVESAHARGNQG